MDLDRIDNSLAIEMGGCIQSIGWMSDRNAAITRKVLASKDMTLKAMLGLCLSNCRNKKNYDDLDSAADWFEKRFEVLYPKEEYGNGN